MYSRIIRPPEGKSFFLFGPRGTGKSQWVRTTFPEGLYLDLLNAELYNDLLARPSRLADLIPPRFDRWVILDEIQKIPSLLDEVHRLIEDRRLRFVLTGSSARKLKQKGVNLLAGRALTYFMHPLTVQELGQDFKLTRSLLFGHLPSACTESDPKSYLEAYVQTYLKEEVQQEGLTRNLGAFSRFLETASFSNGAVLNVSEIARECGIERKVIENYFGILEDLLLGIQLPVFTKRAKRRMAFHRKFFFFDVGVFRTLRPMGPLDLPEEVDGAACENLLFQEARALNAYSHLGYSFYYWRTSNQVEVDLVLYGPRGIKAFEVKRTRRLSSQDSRGLRSFLQDYPMAKAYLVYGGDRREYRDNLTIIPMAECLKELPNIL